ncbi:MAG: hypothetical protein RIQ54_38 [Candidatus Parcubacteria bacterium]|jgi:uncharacterized UBP type Zn finger protein
MVAGSLYLYYYSLYMDTVCTHLDRIQSVTPTPPDGCGDCLAIGDTWVALRLCLTCGHVGCCDSSKNKHATAHFSKTGHPIMQAYREGSQQWKWCYVDTMYL